MAMSRNLENVACMDRQHASNRAEDSHAGNGAAVAVEDAKFCVMLFDMETEEIEIGFASDEREDCELWAVTYLTHDTGKAVAIFHKAGEE